MLQLPSFPTTWGQKIYKYSQSKLILAKEGNFLFVHAGFNDFAQDPYSDIHGMIWECRTFYNNPELRTKTIIHGHRPKKPEFIEKLISENSRVIPIDTGCVYVDEQGYGYLSALDVGAMKLISVENNYP